jgi:hypothetical protein
MLINRVWTGYNLLTAAYGAFTREQLFNANSAAGHIYREDQIKKLDLEGRPTFSYNLYRPVLNQIAGAFKSSVPGISFLPQQPDEEGLAALFEVLNNFICYQQNDLKYELSKAYLDALIMRMTFIRQDWVVSSDYPEGFVRIQHCDPLSIRIDPDTKSRTLEDCNYICDMRQLSPEKIIQIYCADDPDMAYQITDAASQVLGVSSDEKQVIRTWAERLQMLTNFYGSEWKGYDTESNENALSKQYELLKDGLLTTLDFYERRQVRAMYTIDRDGTMTEITALVKKEGKDPKDLTVPPSEWYDNDKLQQIRESHPEITDIKVKLPTKIYQSSVVPILNLVLYDELQDIQSGFRFSPVFAYDWHPSLLETKGVVDDMKDPTRSFSERSNSMLTLMQTYSQGGWLVSDKAIQGYEADWAENRTGMTRKVKDAYWGKTKQVEPPPFPVGYDNMRKEDAELIKQITGSTDSSRGITAESGESGKLFQARVQQSDIMQTWTSDNAQAALKQIAKNNVAFIQKYYTRHDTLMLLNSVLPEGTSQQGKYSMMEINKPTAQGILNDTSAGTFEIQFSPVPFGDTAKQNAYMTLVGINQILGKIDPKLMDIEGMVKNAPITLGKESLVEHVTGVLNQAKQQAKQAQDQAAQQVAQQQQQAPQPGIQGVTPQGGGQQIMQALEQARNQRMGLAQALPQAQQALPPETAIAPEVNQ